MSAWSSADDGWDEGLDFLIGSIGDGFAGVYHEQGQDKWEGPTGFYRTDYRYPPGPAVAKTWDRIFVWAMPFFYGDTMYFSMQAHPDQPLPDDRQYLLTLVSMPDYLRGLPPVGTVWEVPRTGTLTIALPPIRTENGLEGYEFSFTITPVVPEPHVAALVIVAGALLFARRGLMARRRGLMHSV